MNTTTVYKLTRADGTTRNGYQWSLPTNNKLGKWHRAEGRGADLCSDGYLHWYHHPMLAALLHPLHVDFKDAVLWEAEARGEVRDDNRLKGGSKELRLVRFMDMPVFSSEQKAAFAIYAAQAACQDEAFTEWACAWLDGSDRSEAAARAAEAAARAAWAAAWAAARAAARAAWAAARAAAEAAAEAAWAARAAAEAAARAAWAARAAAEAAEAAAEAAEAADPGELLIRCAEKAYNFKP